MNQLIFCLFFANVMCRLTQVEISLKFPANFQKFLKIFKISLNKIGTKSSHKRNTAILYKL